jgi:hypothetical protein
MMSIHEHLPPQARREQGGVDQGFGIGQAGKEGRSGL